MARPLNIINFICFDVNCSIRQPSKECCPELDEYHANNLLKAGIRGAPGGYYKIYTKNRLMGNEIEKLLQDTEIFEYRIENNMLCAKWKMYGVCCRPVFRNPEGKLAEGNQYFLESYFSVSLFSKPDDLYKMVEIVTQKEEAIKYSILKWALDADGVCKDGLFTRRNPPAFSFEYPSDFTAVKLQPNLICRIKHQSGSLPFISITVGEINGDMKQLLDKYAEGCKKGIQDFGGSEVKIIYNRPLPMEVYGKDYPAQEFEIEWVYGGTTPFTSYVNLIVKNGYYISMQGHLSGGGMGDIDEVKAIFGTIDLEP